MIIDVLENLKKYKGCVEGLDKAVAFLKSCPNLPAGKYEIDGDKIFAIVSDCTTVYKSEVLYKAHKKYIDVKYIASGDELMYVQNVSLLKCVQAYDEESDTALYSGDGMTVNLTSGNVVVLFPQDAHVGGMVNDASVSEKKITVKIRIPEKKKKAKPTLRKKA